MTEIRLTERNVTQDKGAHMRTSREDRANALESRWLKRYYNKEMHPRCTLAYISTCTRYAWCSLQRAAVSWLMSNTFEPSMPHWELLPLGWLGWS